MKVLGIIPARGGSKGIPNKNLAPLCGHPLLWWTAQSAAKSLLSRIICSTDSPAIADVAESYGLEIHHRPAWLARDDTRTETVTIEVLKATAGDWDAVCILQPTSPLRSSGDIDGCLKLMRKWNPPAVLTMTAPAEHPARMYELRSGGWSRLDKWPDEPRQKLAPILQRAGSVYLVRTDVLMKACSLKPRGFMGYVVPRERAVNIDTPENLAYAEFLLTRNCQMA